LEGVGGCKGSKQDGPDSHSCGQQESDSDPVHQARKSLTPIYCFNSRCTALFGWFYQVCPKCGGKSRRLVLSKKLVSTQAVETSKRTWSRGGNWPVDEPMTVWLHSYELTRKCRRCGHQWVERTTKQRPW